MHDTCFDCGVTLVHGWENLCNLEHLGASPRVELASNPSGNIMLLLALTKAAFTSY